MKRIYIVSVIFVVGMFILNVTFNKEYEKNIVIEVVNGKVIDCISGISGEDIRYETAIKIDGEILISNNREIYYKAIEDIGKEVEVEIKNNKNTDRKSILDIK
ncbi:MAG: hypothetical protein E6069_08880 [Clostridium perfringens]|uniref:hypothetical protein n=1 Tax=Clostridium sp. TaxID=1506 RepID=UPI002906B7DE|nr:hypothetical protein [Clostridium sp.]MDU5544659.1 hypothetical protein [Clostridium perfringens]MDU5695359.1 hypothetical protein [Clostridium sp.]